MNIAQLVGSAARSFPDRPAVSFGTDPYASYDALWKRIACLARNYREKLGMRPGDRVALAMKNCPQYFEALFAAWHAGLCVVPINFKLHPREIGFILNDSGAKLCLTDSHLAHSIDCNSSNERSSCKTVCVEDAEFTKLLTGDQIDVAPVKPTDPAWLFYTSGTTGRPKGATLSHHVLLAMTLRYYADIDFIDEADSMIHAAPISHAAGLFSLSHFAHAANNVVPAGHGFEPDEIFDLAQHYSNATVFTAPTMLMRLVDSPSVRSTRLDALKTIHYAGAPMYVEDLKRALATLGPRLIGLYGQGETPCTITYLSKRHHIEYSHPRYEDRLASVGIARTGVEIRVVDAQGRDLETGAVGEVIVRSDVSMSGYWNNEAATRQAIRNGWLYTGDLGTLSDDGFLTLKDRSKDLIISGGSNIYPREVEEVLLLHPDVLEASVVGKQDPRWGEQVVAFVARRTGTATAEELDAICLSHIARFKRPKEYIFLESLPKSNYGKILKSELRAMLAR